MASRLTTAIYVAMVTLILYDNFIIQMTQLSNVKVIGLMVDFFLLSVVCGKKLPLIP